MTADSPDERQAANDAARPPDPAPHVQASWRSWLAALASDPDAATAATMVYGTLTDTGRDGWLDAIQSESGTLDVPAIALYAPLLAVEGDPKRIARIGAALAGAHGAQVPLEARALRGVAPSGEHACVVVAPVYGDLVQVVSCRYTLHDGFAAVRCEPLRPLADVPEHAEVEGIDVEPTPMAVVIEDLAHAILADARAGRQPPPELTMLAHLFHVDLV